MPDKTGNVIYVIDKGDFLISFNDHWNQFAQENLSPHMSSFAVKSRSLWDFIQDPETRHFHQALLAKVRAGHSLYNLPFRCDSPGLRRFMEMDIIPLAERQVEYHCRTVKTEKREPIEVKTHSGQPEGSFLRMCSWCKKVDVGEGCWLEIEDAITALGLLAEQNAPLVSHTMCDQCLKTLDECDDGNG